MKEPFYFNEEGLQTHVVNFIQKFYPQVRYCASLGGIRTGLKQAKKAKNTGYVRGFPIYKLQSQEAIIMDCLLSLNLINNATLVKHRKIG